VNFETIGQAGGRKGACAGESRRVIRG